MVTFGTPLTPTAKRMMLLGSGELGKEVAIELMRLGAEVVAVDRYGEKETHLSILGGTIAGDVIVAEINSFTLAGAPTIGGVLNLTSGMKITLGEMQETAIRVKGDGAFSLTAMFLGMWRYVTGENEPLDEIVENTQVSCNIGA